MRALIAGMLMFIPSLVWAGGPEMLLMVAPTVNYHVTDWEDETPNGWTAADGVSNPGGSIFTGDTCEGGYKYASPAIYTGHTESLKRTIDTASGTMTVLARDAFADAASSVCLIQVFQGGVEKLATTEVGEACTTLSAAITAGSSQVIEIRMSTTTPTTSGCNIDTIQIPIP